MSRRGAPLGLALWLLGSVLGLAAWLWLAALGAWVLVRETVEVLR